MLNVIQLMDDEGLGHCKRMVTFAKLISKTGDKIVFLISDKKKYQAKVLDHEDLEFIEYDYSLGVDHTFSLVIEKRCNPNLRSWSIDTKRNCIETLKFIKDQGVYTRLFDNSAPCRLLADENIYPTPLFDRGDLDWSNYKGKVLGGWEQVLLGEKIRSLKLVYDKTKRKNCVISFGGSDPQNLTLKIMELLSIHVDEVPIVVIVGANFRNTTNIFNFNEKIGNKFKLVIEPKNIDNYIASAKLLFTAVGLTLVEAIFLGISTVCISNHFKDKRDLERLKRFKNVFVFDNFKKLSYREQILLKVFRDTYGLPQ